MGLDGWLGLVHLFTAAVWAAALAAVALRATPDVPHALSLSAGLAAFGAVLTGVWLLHRAPALLTMTHMHVKAVALVALGLLDHLLIRGLRPGPFAARGLRVGAVLAAVAAASVAALLGPEAA